MKFKSLTMKNFMRYKGENTISFSLNDNQNVTVVLGDNTVGKTTIAQAFRWGLYGNLLIERGKKEDDYTLLNNDVIQMMTEESKASVSVEIVLIADDKRYTMQREIVYRRRYPTYVLAEVAKIKKLYISDISSNTEDIQVDENKIDTLINELLPRNLSHYFLFDGERWNDISIGGVRENIKDSVHILTGLSSMQAAMKHIKDMGSNSVISKFKSNIKGAGAIFDNLQNEAKRDQHAIVAYEEQIKIIDNNIKNVEKNSNEIEDWLLENKGTEALQLEYRQKKVVVQTKGEQILTNYKSLVNTFSDKAYIIFAEPMVKASIDILKKANLQRRDVPHMRQTTIDYLINKKECICGTKILPESKELHCLLEQRNYLPPADLGSILGEFERSANKWTIKNTDYYENIKECALDVGNVVRKYNDVRTEFEMLGKRLDEHIDFSTKREELRENRNKLSKLAMEKSGITAKISSLKTHIESLEREMQLQEARTQENAKWRMRLDMAQQLYEKLDKNYTSKENKTFMELNKNIQMNFERMFNEKDKKIELDKNYNINMFYRNGIGFKEEKNLSEGEKIARNFAFIVTIMEYSKNKKISDSSENDTLPIVLDGPFSKLGDENIGLIAKVLPDFAEQVIIFMLKKDWKYTGLDEYVGARYEIDKAADEAYAKIRKVI